MTTSQAAMGYDAPAAYEDLIAPRYAPVADELVDTAALAPGERVLELGAGTGLVTRRAVEAVGAGGLVVASDRSVKMLELARAAVEGRALFVVVDYEQPLPFLDRSFDVVLSSLTYAQDRAQTLAEVQRVLKPGGRLAFTMWGEDYLELRIMNAAKERAGAAPLPGPRPADAARRLAECGFADVDRRDFELAPLYDSVEEYLAYRRGFGVPLGSSVEEHERVLQALGEEARQLANADGSFTQGWRFALVTGSRPGPG